MNPNLLRICAFAAAIGPLAACSSSNGGSPADGGATEGGSSSSRGPSGDASGDSPGSAVDSGSVDSGVESGALDGSPGDQYVAEASPGVIADGGSAAGSGTLSGTFGGQTLMVQSAVAGRGANTNLTAISLLNLANACAIASSSNVQVHDTQSLVLTFLPTTPLVPGTFDVITGSAAQVGAYYLATDATCAPASGEQAVSGTITIATTTASEITGSFNLMLAPIGVNMLSPIDTGTSTLVGVDHVTGSFDAPICAALSAELGGIDDGGATAAAACN